MLVSLDNIYGQEEGGTGTMEWSCARIKSDQVGSSWILFQIFMHMWLFC